MKKKAEVAVSSGFPEVTFNLLLIQEGGFAGQYPLLHSLGKVTCTLTGLHFHQLFLRSSIPDETLHRLKKFLQISALLTGSVRETEL